MTKDMTTGNRFAFRLFPGMRQGLTSEIPLPIRVLGKIIGDGYHRPSAEDAQRRILAFFDTYLKSAES